MLSELEGLLEIVSLEMAISLLEELGVSSMFYELQMCKAETAGAK